MPWKRRLAYVTGEVEDSLLLRIEYLIEENAYAERFIRSNRTECLGGLLSFYHREAA